ncbi:hypothetical protein [Neobacillus niacini]|uniref:DODA-type extradiol aromatic ring-opening family dioxygenase n=1 Tax=Neobacillus niacini TaxID=86668 RepID=UPI00398324B3
MARIIQGIGMSHSPMMAMEGQDWPVWVGNDENHNGLFDETGKHVSYEELAKQRNNAFAHLATPEKLLENYNEMNVYFEKLKAEVQKANPDLIVIIANDHPGEFLQDSNIPALAIYQGEHLISVDERRRLELTNKRPVLDPSTDKFQRASELKWMDKNNYWPSNSKVAGQLIESLMEQHFDCGLLREQPDPTRHGHGHGYGMVITKLLDPDQQIPIIPVYLNIRPPNVLTSSRTYDIGRALRKAIEDIPEDFTVSIICSGGLSHFVTDEYIDRKVLNAIRNRSENELRTLPPHRLKAGSGEIRNWVSLAACCEHLQWDWDHYIPVYRTPAGTGIGIGYLSMKLK